MSMSGPSRDDMACLRRPMTCYSTVEKYETKQSAYDTAFLTIVCSIHWMGVPCLDVTLLGKPACYQICYPRLPYLPSGI